MFQLQRAITRTKTKRSPGTFSDCAVFGLIMARCSLNVLPSFNSADLIYVVLLTVINWYIIITHSGMAAIKILVSQTDSSMP
jgi:hypothetical protein